jgi:hypothetical protein
MLRCFEQATPSRTEAVRLKQRPEQHLAAHGCP